MTLKDVIVCPKCGGKEIVYSCEPKCCFNHVCADCRSTFELNTSKTGRFDHQTAISAKEPDSSDPTTGCASCGTLRMAVLSSTADETLLLCANGVAILLDRRCSLAMAAVSVLPAGAQLSDALAAQLSQNADQHVIVINEEPARSRPGRQQRHGRALGCDRRRAGAPDE